MREKSEYERRMEQFKKTMLLDYLRSYQGNISHIEKEKGFPRCTIYRLIKKFKIDLKQFRKIKFIVI